MQEAEGGNNIAHYTKQIDEPYQEVGCPLNTERYTSQAWTSLLCWLYILLLISGDDVRHI